MIGISEKRKETLLSSFFHARKLNYLVGKMRAIIVVEVNVLPQITEELDTTLGRVSRKKFMFQHSMPGLYFSDGCGFLHTGKNVPDICFHTPQVKGREVPGDRIELGAVVGEEFTRFSIAGDTVVQKATIGDRLRI